MGCSANMDLLRISRAVLDPDRRAHESEGVSDLILEESLIGEVQLHAAVGEEDEGRRSDRGLRHVENLYALTHRDRCSFEIDVFKESVHL
jgi:hypothetical protein